MNLAWLLSSFYKIGTVFLAAEGWFNIFWWRGKPDVFYEGEVNKLMEGFMKLDFDTVKDQLIELRDKIGEGGRKHKSFQAGRFTRAILGTIYTFAWIFNIFP